MNELLTIQEAFEAMRCFLIGYYERTESDDVGSLLGDTQILEDGDTADSAAWEDWLECVKKVKDDDKGYALS